MLMRQSKYSNALARFAAILIAGTLLPLATAAAGDAAPKVGLIMEKLPPQKSKQYRKLRSLAGKATGQALEMTKSEVWNVPPEHVDALIQEAARQGVSVTKIDANWNHTLAPMSPDKPMSEVQKRMMHDAMQSKAAMGVNMMALPRPSALEYALTKDMAGGTKGGPLPSIVIPLNATASITAVRKHIEKQGDSYVWHGEIQGTGEPVTLVCWPGGRLSGNISYGGHIYAIKSMGDGMHGVVEMSPDGLPPEHAPMGAEKMREMNMKSDPLVKQGDAKMMEDAAKASKATETRQLQPDRADTRNLEDAGIEKETRSIQKRPRLTGNKFQRAKHAKKNGKRNRPVEITLMAAYTKAAASYFSDIEKDLIALAIADTNESFRASGVNNVRVKLVHSYQTDYVEKGGQFDHVYAMTTKGDGLMDDVDAIRDKHRADVVVLVVHDPVGCGLAARVAAEADRAFAVVHHECAATTYSLAHEIGHLIGARHDIGLDDSTEPYAYGHGFVNGTAWRTMMSYKESCGGCPRLPIWSNPAIKVKGVSAGDAQSNNAKVLRARAAVVAAFR